MKVEVYFPLLLQQMQQKWGGGSKLLDFFYPVGTYYETSNTSFNPNTSWGGTWVQDTIGLVTAGAVPEHGWDTYPELQLEGGEVFGEVNHALTEREMPSHSHIFHSPQQYYGETGNEDASILGTNTTTTQRWVRNTSYVGEGKEHNNVQPSIGVYRWHRTA